MALVMAVGVDKGKEPGRLLVTVQIARPSASHKGQGGSAAGDQLGPVYTASAEGDSIFAAIRNLAQFTSRRIMWAHNNAVFVGEELAREDITPVVDFFTRNQELRMRTWMVVARGARAETLVAAKTGMEPIPANTISALFRYGQLPGESVRTDVASVAEAFLAADTEPVISAMSLRPEALPEGDRQGDKGGRDQVQLRGTAVFRHNRLVGFVDTDAGRGLLWLRGEMRNAVVSIPCPDRGGKKITIEIRTPTSKVSSTIRAGKPEFFVQAKADGILMEQDCSTPRMGMQQLEEYAETEFARRIEENVRAALRALQGELRADAAKFGHQVHAEHPEWWAANKERWRDLFPTVKVTVAVTVDVPKMGLYVMPMNAK